MLVQALLIVAALVLALPLGWGLGVVLAYLIAGHDVGQLPAGTVPLCIVGAVIFVVVAPLSAQKRLIIMAAATAIFAGLMALLPL